MVSLKNANNIIQTEIQTRDGVKNPENFINVNCKPTPKTLKLIFNFGPGCYAKRRSVSILHHTHRLREYHYDNFDHLQIQEAAAAGVEPGGADDDAGAGLAGRHPARGGGGAGRYPPQTRGVIQ